MEAGGGWMAVNKAEIDTSAPFRSVKEAVMLFGERVLAGEVYATKLKEMQYERSSESELEETKQSLQKAHEQSIHMAQCLTSLQQELYQTKRELQKLKTRAFDRRALNLEDGEITEQVKKETTDGDQNVVEFQKNKCVTFANPPLVAQVIMPPPPPPPTLPPRPSEAVLQSHPSLKKKKKKPLIPFIGGIFSKKRGSNTVILA